MDFPTINARDVIVRAQVRKLSGQNVSISLRCGTTRRVAAWFNGSNLDGGDFFGIGRQFGGPSRDIANSHIGRKTPPDQFVEMAFAAIGDTLTLYVDGTRVIIVKSDKDTSGYIRIAAFRGKGLFKELEYQILDPVPASNPAVGTGGLPQ
jgi:hypothetical protein